MNAISLSPQDAQALIAALCALTCALLIITLATRGARARAKERARIWGELKRPDMEARALRASQARASGARTEARLRGALMSAVALVALATTNLSAHATINSMHQVGLTSVDTAISVVIAFEAFLGVFCALSWWHRRSGTGFNVYELGVWTMASLMGTVAWWGGGNPIFALWPILAAVAWHVVVTFGKDRKPSPVARWWRTRFGIATDRDATEVDTKRRWSAMAAHGYYAHQGLKFMRPVRARMLKRAQMRAQQLGIMTDEARAYMQSCAAALYFGARAFAPEEVARMNPWVSARIDERAFETSAHARTVRAPKERASKSARVIEVSAHDERAPMSAHEDVSAPAEGARTERASEDERASMPEVSVYDPADMPAVIRALFGAKRNIKAMEWTVEFWELNGRVPSGDELGAKFGLTGGNCRKWMTKINGYVKAQG